MLYIIFVFYIEFAGCIAESQELMLNTQNIRVLNGVGVEGWVAVDEEESDWKHCAVGNEKLLKSNGGKCILSKTGANIYESFVAKYSNTGTSILICSIDDSIRLLIALSGSKFL